MTTSDMIVKLTTMGSTIKELLKECKKLQKEEAKKPKLTKIKMDMPKIL